MSKTSIWEGEREGGRIERKEREREGGRKKRRENFS